MTEGPQHPHPPANAYTPRSAVQRRRIRRRTATVWTLPQSPAAAPAVSLPGWLEAAVRRIATTYTRRGDRILLLALPEPDTGRPGPGRGGEETLPGLVSVARGLARQGRQAHLRTLAAPAPPADSASPDPAPGSGPRLDIPTPLEAGPDRPGPTIQPGPVGRPAPANPRSGLTGHRPRPADRSETDAPVGRPDGYDLAITFLLPDTADWTASAPWTSLLSPRGILTLITQSDAMRKWHDGHLDLLEHITGRSGLALLDRIVLLAAPATAASSAPAPPPGAARGHTELLVLARPGTAGEPGTGAAGTGVCP